MRACILGIIGTFAAGCTSPPQATQSQASAPSEFAASCDQGSATTSAGGGWDNDFVSQLQLSWNQQAQIAVTPHEPSGGPIDAVIGFANGPAQEFTDLGPIVRFNPDGFIDARDGSTYRANEPVRYTDGTQYVISYQLDFMTHTYSASVGRYGSPDRNEIAFAYSFRTEQSAMSRVDTLAREIDSPTGDVSICGYAASANCMTASPPNWTPTPFRAQSGAFHLEVAATAYGDGTDAVVGLAGTATPSRFSDLAAIFRFNPYGHMDVRNGGAYTADVDLTWTPGETYRVAFDVDVAAHRYSVTVTPTGGAPVRIATDYAFRTEQAGVTSLVSLGQFVDSPYGKVQTCGLLETY